MKNDEYLYRIRHSAEHIFNQAIEELYPGKVLRAIGPAIEDGFYNDSRWSIEISDEKFPEIEKRMQEIVDADLKFTERDISEKEAREMFKDNPFKQELIDEFIEEGKKLTVYSTGDNKFVDLCAGPHVGSTGEVKTFKLLTVAGAYWRGSEKNEMLTRVYGTAFATKEELEKHLAMLEEAKRRDHRKLGKDLGLFVFSDVVGKGLPLWTEKGTTVRRELERFIVDEEIRRGYKHVMTPDMAKLDLYKKSGHYPYYKDSMYPAMESEGEEFMLRPMTCPHHFELYLSQPRSYKELPMRIAELAKLYRYEKSGELSGLIRVRSFCLADAHIVCADKEQAQSEVGQALDLIEDMAKIFGLKMSENYRYRLSLGDRSDETKYFKDDKAWEDAENILRDLLVQRKADFYEGKGEAAFYGPKIDIQMKNVLGKEDTAFTVQYDFVMPKRFDLKYTNDKGEEAEALVVHRSSIGAIERIMAFLIEHFAGAFPTWLAPVQVEIIPISEKFNEYARKIANSLREAQIRVEIDENPETMGNKIRKAQEQKVPYMIIVGGKEEESNTISVRYRDGKQANSLDLSAFTDEIKNNIMSKSLS